MALPGARELSLYGPGADDMIRATSNGPTLYNTPAINTGWCARFMAYDTRDIKSVFVSWIFVTSPGTVTITIETVDASTGKPTGSLYDANATLTFTPTVGVQELTFASLPTTGLVAGTVYAIVMIKVNTGTTLQLRSSAAGIGCLPTTVMTAADGTTRSNFAAVGSSTPICTIKFEDDVEEPMDFCPYLLAQSTSTGITGTRAEGMKFVVEPGLSKTFSGIICSLGRVGTPPADIRFRIFSGSSVVAGTTITIDKDFLPSNAVGQRLRFASPVTFPSGTYRAVFDSSGASSAANCYRMLQLTTHNASLIGSNFCMTSTADCTAGTITWSDEATKNTAISLRESSVLAPNLLVNPGMGGGING